MPSALTYRLYRDTDLPHIIELWEQDSGWGAMTPELWRKWYIETPHGECLIVVAVDAAGEICGQEVFTPTTLALDGAEVKALRLSAPILRKDLRRASIKNVDHPVIGLYMTGAQAAAERGYKVVYALPEHNWLPFFRWCPRFGLPTFLEAEYECLELALDSGRGANGIQDKHFSDKDFTVRQATEFGEEYEALWREACREFPIRCGIVRGRRWLEWKIQAHLVLEVRQAASKTLIGYIAIKRDSNLIVDLLARNRDELSCVLTQAISWLQNFDEVEDALPRVSLKAMETPVLSKPLRDIGFTAVDYKFAFVCNALDAEFDKANIEPHRWYVMPKD